MATTVKLIAKSVLGSSASSISFTSIPGTFTDLMLVCSLRSSQADTVGYAGIQFNGDTGSNYSGRYLNGNGSGTPGSASYTSTRIYGQGTGGDSSTSNTFSSMEFYIPNYAGSTNKSVSLTNVNETNATAAYMTIVAGLWSNTAAITQIDLLYPGYNFLANSSAYLYGITKA